jgi:hypothetical protein
MRVYPANPNTKPATGRKYIENKIEQATSADTIENSSTLCIAVTFISVGWV